MTAATAFIDALLCCRCTWPAGLCTCVSEDPEALVAQCRERHARAVHRAIHGPPDRPELPEPPRHARWVVWPGFWSTAHLIDTTGRSLCGKATCGLGSRPAQAGARWCRLCAHSAGLDGVSA